MEKHCPTCLCDRAHGDTTGFHEFWTIYPRRNGRKVGKLQALNKWKRYDIDERRRIYRATKNYAAAISRKETIAKDAERFLSNDYWHDWLETVSVQVASPNRPSHVPSHAQWDPTKGQWVA